MSRWFRFYDDTLHDPKVLRLSDSLYRAWTILLCFASKNDGVLPPAADIALALRIKPAVVCEWITKLVQGELIDQTEAGFEPHNWSGRQYQSDVTDPTAAIRMKRYRSNKRNDRNATVTVIRPDTEAETEQSQSRADTRDVTQKRIGDFRQAIVRAYAEANSPTLPDTSRAELWISQGYEEDICLAVIGGIVRKKPNASLAYFDGPIKEAHASKAPPRKAVNGPPPIDWRAVLTSYKRFGHWSRDAGNDPTSPSCRAPPELLREFGFEPVVTQ